MSCIISLDDDEAGGDAGREEDDGMGGGAEAGPEICVAGGEQGGLASDMGGVVGGVDTGDEDEGDDAPKGLKLRLKFILLLTSIKGEWGGDSASSGRKSGTRAS